MSRQCVVAEFGNVLRAGTALEVLATSGYQEDHVSIVSAAGGADLNLLQSMSDEAEGHLGLSASTMAGGVLGALTTPLAVSPIGPFMLIGPLVAIGIGSALGSFLGLANHSPAIDDHTHPNYRRRIEDGGVIVIGTGRDPELRDMEALLKTADPISLNRFTLPVMEQRVESP